MKCGVGGKMLNVIKRMYNVVKTKVYSNGDKSDSIDCELGLDKANVYHIPCFPFILTM